MAYMSDPIEIVIPAPTPEETLTKYAWTGEYDEAYRDGYIDAIKHISALIAGGYDDVALDDWIEEKLEANE